MLLMCWFSYVMIIMWPSFCNKLHIFRFSHRILWNFQQPKITIGAWRRQSLYMLNLDRNFYLSSSNFKRRKTGEEKKSDRIIEYSPKKSANKKVVFGTIDIWRNMTVQDLANALNKDIEHIQEAMLYVDDANNLDPTARLENIKVIKDIANKCGMKTKIVSAPTDEIEESKDKDVMRRPPASPENLKHRPPVVTVMGHVDHGKTTLLDSLRGASVALSEAGGITQHIGAFTVVLDNGDAVTFLDTPGHAAFSAMRARGADLTDIIVLVVAADDGVMEQTREVIKLAQSSNVPIIAAINKIDKPEADIERTIRELSQMGIMLEGHGGETQYVGVSALKSINLKELAEAVSTQATLMGLKAEYIGLVEGSVVESRLDSKRGKLSTAIVTRGTLRKGCILVSGTACAKVRGLFNHLGEPIEAATPGTPVEILGWRELPLAGEEILEVESERKAGAVIRYRESYEQRERAEGEKDAILKKELEHLEKYRKEREARRLAGRYKSRPGQRMKEAGPDDSRPKVSIIIKGDVHGSVEAILDVLETYSEDDKVRLNIVHYGVGEVNEGDLELAKTFNAIIYAFSVKPPPSQKIDKAVKIREVNIIYRLVDDLKEEINKKLPMVEEEEIIGEANVLQLFRITEGKKEVNVLGCRCTKGVLKKSAKYKIIRQGEPIHTGALDSMRHLKNEVDTIKRDVECGLRLIDQTVVPEPGDIIVCFNTQLKPQTTEWDPGF